MTAPEFRDVSGFRAWLTRNPDVRPEIRPVEAALLARLDQCPPVTSDQVGRCGNWAPEFSGAAPRPRQSCRLPFGHPGSWHRGDDGSEWTVVVGEPVESVRRVVPGGDGAQ